MAGKKLTAAERLAKLKAKQGERGKEFAGGKKPPTPEPPQKAPEEKPSVFDKPPAQPEKEEPAEDNKTQGLDLDDSAVMDVSEEAPSTRAPSTRLDSTPPAAVEEPEEAADVEESAPAPPVAEESASIPEAPSFEDLLAPPAEEAEESDPFKDPDFPARPDQVDSSSVREDETKPEVKRPSKPPARTLLSADLEDPLATGVADEPIAETSEEVKEPEGVKHHVHARENGETTSLVSGIVVNYVMPSASSKIFMINGPSGAQSLELAPGDEKSFELETPDGKVSITMQNKEGEVTAYVQGGKTKAGAVAEKAGKAGAFLANVRYYLPEVTMAGLFTAATTAVLWSQQFISDTLQNFHKPAVIAYGVFQLALTTWAIIEQKKVRKTAEAQEAVKE